MILKLVHFCLLILASFIDPPTAVKLTLGSVLQKAVGLLSPCCI
ncbi:hypothetical protein NIES4074_06120 [Cylindrospermum sp. NIES-4074]|nr:hypothetical protein NIES4074_06120 [Cylindrospermum sp. NIES-4074]